MMTDSEARAARNRELGRRVREKDADARREMIEANIPLAVREAALHASWLRGRWSVQRPINEIRSDAFLGLIHAVDGYDPDTFEFSTYASHTIRGYLQKNRPGPIVTVPANLRGNSRMRAESRHAEKIEAAMSVPRSLDSHSPPERGPDACDRLIAREEVDILRSMIDRLPRFYRDILILRYGLDDGRIRTYAEIGERVGCLRYSVSDHETTALDMLREMVNPGRAT